MQFAPLLRRFRFRLSTVLILTAIAAWAMATRPVFDWGHERSRPIAPPNYTGIQIFTNLDFRPASSPDWDGVAVMFTRCVAHNADEYWFIVGPRKFFWPLCALAAFLAWKAARAVVERRRRQSATSE